MPIWIAVIGVLLTLSSLNVGWIMDDYHHRLVMTDHSGNARQFLSSKLDLFRFMDGRENINRLMDYGLLPWWTDSTIKGAFWRPITSITHWIDYHLWPENSIMMHLQNVLWYCLLCMAAGSLYRKFIPIAWVAGLAALLYAVDDTHATPVAFLASRNAIIAAVFGILAIYFHDCWRRDGFKLGGVLGPGLLALSLLSAEAGIGTCAYLGAYVFFVDEAKWRRRLISMIPYIGIVIVWRLVWLHLGYGIVNIGLYVDPVSEPLRYLLKAVERIPFLLAGQWTLLPSEIKIFVDLHIARFMLYIAIVFLVLLSVVFWPLLRKDRLARFWALGMILALLPICATFPSNRLLIFVSIGTMGLLARFFTFVFDKNRDHSKVWHIPAVILVSLLMFIHLIASPVSLVVKSAMPMGPNKLFEKFYVNFAMDSAISGQDLIVVNPPVSMVASYSPLIWQCDGDPIPKHMRILTSSLMGPVTVYRADEKTIVVRPEWGYLAFPMDQLFRRLDNLLTLGQKVWLTGMTVEVTELTGDGRPAEAKFIFSVPLEDKSLRWLQFKDGEFVPFVPPAIGKSVELISSMT
jgi:hypothetical protein